MSFSAPIDPHQSMKAQLAYTLRALRTVKGLSQNQLAKELYATREAIAAYETGRNRPDVEFCERLDEFFGTGEMFQSLWGHAQHEHLREWLEAYIGHETEASQIRTFQSMYIPGLLQTEEYMRASADDPKLPGWYRGMDGAMVLLTKPDRTAVGYVEAQFGGRLMEDPAEAADLALRFDQIGVRALSDDASRALIFNTMETMRDDPLAEE